MTINTSTHPSKWRTAKNKKCAGFTGRHLPLASCLLLKWELALLRASSYLLRIWELSLLRTGSSLLGVIRRVWKGVCFAAAAVI